MARAERKEPTSSVEGRSFFDRVAPGVWGLGIAVLGLLMLLALMSYWWNSPGDGTASANNLIGPLGARLAEMVYWLLGLGGVLIAVGAVAIGVALVSQAIGDVSIAYLLGMAVLLPPFMVVLELLMPERNVFPYGGGGVIGYGLGLFLTGLLDKTGTVILCVASLIAGVSIIFQVQVKSFFLAPWRGIRWVFSRLRPRRDVGGVEGNDLAGTAVATPRQARAEERKGGGSARVVQPDRAEEVTRLARPVRDHGKVEETRPTTVTTGAGVAAGSGGAPPPALQTSAPTEEGVTRRIVQPDLNLPVAEEEGEGEQEAGKDGVVPIRIDRSAEEKPFVLPDLGLLDFHPPRGRQVDNAALMESARILEEKLRDFKVDGTVGDIHPGPVVTLFEFRPGRGIKVNTIANLSKDLAMALAAEQVRVIAPIPGRDVVGFEIPNKVREIVYLRELLADPRYRDSKLRLPLVLGKDISGRPTFADLTKMPHLLVAGTTGSGKSVALHSFMLSILYRLPPSQVRFILVDTKMLELTAYAEIPHLYVPVVTEAREAAVALRWAVGEMERRNRLMSSAGVPNISEYNQMASRKKEEGVEELPYIVVVIDELADLMMVAGKQVETSVARLAQMARAAGIHMIIATQNPTIKVVTGIIKANMPARISFKVRTMQDSRVVLDQNGADDLLGWGDMLFLPPGSSKLQRIHGAFVSTEERSRVVEYLRTQGAPKYNSAITEVSAAEELEENEVDIRDRSDDLYEQAVALAIARGKISTSALQRELGVGYNKAALLMSRMEKEGLVGPQESAGKPRVVLKSR